MAARTAVDDFGSGPLQTLIVTSGEPAGSGPDLCLALAERDWPCRLLVAGDPALLAARAAEIGLKLRVRAVAAAAAEPHARGTLQVLPTQLASASVAGQPDIRNVPYVLEMLR